MAEPASLRSLREVVFWPALAASWPWRLGHKLLDEIARRTGLYDAEVDAALASASTVTSIEDSADWKRRCRLTRLIDYCDLFLVRTRSRRWIAKHVDVTGKWPDRGPFIAMTFHWGRTVVDRAHALARNASALRRVVRRAGLDDWSYAADESVRSAIQLSAGMARLAVESRLPVVAFEMGVDFATGRRSLRIEPPFVATDEQDFAHRLALIMTRILRRDSAAWHFSHLAGHFFGPPAAVRE